jgi:hypothetical protein
MSRFEGWLLINAVPILLLAAALALMVGNGRGKRARLRRRLGGVLAALGVIGFAVGGAWLGPALFGG